MMELWMWVVAGIVVWLVGAIGFETHAWYIKKYQGWRWARRQDGLISFSNKQFMYMRWTWPIIGFLTVVFFALVYLSHAIVFIFNAFTEEVVHSYPNLNVLSPSINVDEDKLIELANEVGDPAENPIDRFPSRLEAVLWMSRMGELIRNSISPLIQCTEENLVYFEQIALIASQYTDIDFKAAYHTHPGLGSVIHIEMVGAVPPLDVTVNQERRSEMAFSQELA